MRLWEHDGKKFKKKKKIFYKKKNTRRKRKIQKGGAFGAGMALDMFLPQILGAASNILKVNI